MNEEIKYEDLGITNQLLLDKSFYEDKVKKLEEEKNSALMRGGELEKYIGELEEKVRTYSEEYEILRKENRELKNELMEDMKTETALNNIIKHYKEENKKLKEYNGELIENHKKDIAILCEENKSLKDKIAKLEFDIEARKKWKKAIGL